MGRDSPPHKHLINRADLSAGTGFALKEIQYPGMTKSAAMSLLMNGAP